MPSYSHSSSRHLQTRLLQLCPLRSTFIHSIQPLSSVLHTSARLIKDLIPKDHITPTLKQRHWLPMPILHSKSPSSYIISILEPLHHTCHPWLRHALLLGLKDSDYPLKGTLLYNSHKAEVWKSCFLGRWTYREWNSLPFSVRQCTSVA